MREYEHEVDDILTLVDRNMIIALRECRLLKYFLV